MRRLLKAATVCLLASLPALAPAHEVRPGYLELRQSDAEVWRVLWKVPARGEMLLSIRPRFPANCRTATEPIVVHNAGAHIERVTLQCAGGLQGREISIDGLAATMTDVLVRSVRLDDSVQIARLTPSAPAFVFEAAPGWLPMVRTYTALGIEHILGGVDHLLFVLGLLLLVRGPLLLVKTITAFTLAHSVTLASSTLGWVRVQQAPVEAVIALSILFLASELAKQRSSDTGLMQRYPWIVAFTFGLLHGFGFAGALHEIGLPEGDIPLALLTFNIGVEIGQLLFVGVVLLVLSGLRRVRLQIPAWAQAAPAYGIGTVAAFWTLQRMALLF